LSRHSSTFKLHLRIHYFIFSALHFSLQSNLLSRLSNEEGEVIGSVLEYFGGVGG
jgi:hypothetical protein